MEQWVEVTAAQVRELPEGTKARLYSRDKYGYTQWLEGFVHHREKGGVELYTLAWNEDTITKVRDYRNKVWKILKED